MQMSENIPISGLKSLSISQKDCYAQFQRALAKNQDHIKDHPYCFLSHIQASNYYYSLGYPDLAAGAAYKALLLSGAIEDNSDEYHEVSVDALNEYIASLSADDPLKSLETDTKISAGDAVKDKLYSHVLKENKLPLYRLLISTLSLCGCYKTAADYYSQGKIHYKDSESLRQAYDNLRETVAKHFDISVDDLDKDEKYSVVNWPDSGYVRREVYPWNEHEPDRLRDLDVLNELMAEVAPKLEVKLVNLPTLASDPSNACSDTVQQFGVFAKEDVGPREVILDETSMLTANNRLQDTLCDACSADLPELGSDDAVQPIQCPDCEVVFCSEECYDTAVGSYHPALCEMDIESIGKDVAPDQAAESLYSLLLLRAMAMAETQQCHPLDLKEVKYIWGDFHNAPAPGYQYPMTDEYYRSDKINKSLRFSFKYNIELPFHMLEKMEIDIFANPQYDVWVFNSLYAKFRGTASARLSGSAGSAARGPEVGAVHPMWCLANHSCDPNVSWEWGGSIKFWVRGQRVTWQKKDGSERRSAAGIKKGEEVLNHYCDIDLPVNERREWMRGTLGGDCRCARCVWEANEAV